MNGRARLRALVWACTAAALLYSAAHFVQSGIVFPLSEPNLGKFEEETPALRAHIQTGQPVHFNNAVQYGSVFFLVVHPLLLWTHSDQSLAHWLYAIQLVCIAAGFLATWLTLEPLVPPREGPLVIAWLVVIWANFTPLLTTVAVKSVETWELCLIVVALYAYVRDKLWVMAFALSAAALVKVLPLIFFYYLLVTDRRACLRACAALAVLLLASQIVYGSEMGIWYLPHLASSAAGDSYGLTWHENLSIKAAVAKLFGHLETLKQPGRSGFSVLLTPAQLKATILVGDVLVLLGLALLTWTWLRDRNRARSTERILWEWSLVTVAMLILSPNTTFEYATLALGAISYAVVRALSIGAGPRTWISLGGAMFLLGVLLPRQVLNGLTLVALISRWSGYVQLTPSEAYQYYCFPLAGLFLLVAALWMLRPMEAQSPARV